MPDPAAAAVKYSIADAADLVAKSYTPELLGNKVRVKRPDKDDVSAIFLTDGTLLLPGSNSLEDYLKFNLRLLNIGHKQLKFSDDKVEKGFSRTLWHQGFLTYSKAIFDWLGAENLRPTRIIGHSLGGAAAQIMCKTYTVPTLAFAAPRPKWVAGPIANDKLCLTIVRSDDPVPDLPPFFSHMGPVMRLPVPQNQVTVGHKMQLYIKLIGQMIAAGAMPEEWPL
jgi:hypothetical protein